MLALDPVAVVEQRRQRPEGHCLGGRGLGGVREVAGSEQVGQHLRFQPVGADLAPHDPDDRFGRLVLVHVARAPGREPHRLVLVGLGLVLVRWQE